MRKQLFLFLAIVALLVALLVYIGWAGSAYWQAILPEVPLVVYVTVYVLLAFGYMLAMLLRRVLPYRMFKLLRQVGSIGMGLLYYAILLVPLGHLAVWGLMVGGMTKTGAIVSVGTVLVVVLAVLAVIGLRNAWSPVVRRYELTIAKRLAGRQELRVAVASDLHLGTMVGTRHLRRLVRQVEAMKPDLILLPGDVLDDSIEPFVQERMEGVMQQLRAPLGVYAVLGNHEYIGGHVNEYVERMKAIGIEVLLDRTVELEGGLVIAGRKDYAVERFAKSARLTVSELLDGIDRTKPIVLLDHQPYKLDKAAEAGADIMLSGHTHRGQMMPNHLITRRLFELDWGYVRKGSMHALVSSGFGFWGPPMRIGSRSELLQLDIRFTS
ncbi:metallophosphoesterase [Paenibacillus sp. YYML68]|uniref:metallophosphoesterase n=1 Tax=Paenibacillus sp. YYML68 TaxID=2909250 RepID=UPI00249059C8|nr:metallophosphoesterase [Paenibacillus sp. YYML68]